MSESNKLITTLDDAPLSLFHLKAVLTAGAGFFTDAYDLFIIGAALVLLKGEWHLSKEMIGLIGSTSLIAAFLGAFIFGRISDAIGRKKVYVLVASIIAVGALLCAFSPNILWLMAFRFVMGLGIGGDYPVSAVLTSEYSNTKDRGKLIGLVFSMQALGLITGPIVAMTLLASGINQEWAWRIMLGLGALPAGFVVYARSRMPESPRYQALMQGKSTDVDLSLHSNEQEPLPLLRKRIHFTPRIFLTLIGTAGTWFLFDYAYYGNTISTPLIMKMIAPHASPVTAEAWSLIIFVIAALPGYILAFSTIDKIGHKKLQWIGFLCMGLAFLIMGIFPSLTTMVLPFLVLYGISYFFAEFGPNTTTFIMPAELFPVSMRTTGHGVSAGFAKLGAFIGASTFPVLSGMYGLSGALVVSAVVSFLGLLLTMVLPEPSGQSIDQISERESMPSVRRSMNPERLG